MKVVPLQESWSWDWRLWSATRSCRLVSTESRWEADMLIFIRVIVQWKYRKLATMYCWHCNWSRLLDMCSFSGCSGHWYGIWLGFGQKCPEKLLTCIFLPSLLLSDVSTQLQDSLWHNVQVNIDADNIHILLYLFQCHFCRSIVVENNFRFNRNVRLHWPLDIWCNTMW